MFSDPPVFPGRIDPSDRFRDRRRRARRRRRLRRLVAVAVLCGGIVALALNARFISGGERPASPPAKPAATGAPPETQPARPLGPRPLPTEIRGVHVTMALASLPGKIDEYIALRADGLNTIELDIKDEKGDVAFRAAGASLARQMGAVQRYYDPSEVADRVHAAGLYLVGRLVVFEDPRLAEGRPDFAIRTAGGGVWRNDAGLAWTNPYDERVWDYNVDIAEAAARAGFDEIMFDYVRFPSDGDVSSAVYAGERREPKWQTIASFVRYASERLRPLGVRVSAAVFGLAATRDLGIGQRPRKLAPYLDAIYPMVYPSHYGSGEYQIPDPSAEPGLVVSRSLLDFRARLDGTGVKLVPWLQDFSLGRAYTFEDVSAQVAAARRAHSLDGRVVGFMLWNAGAVYTSGVLAPAP